MRKLFYAIIMCVILLSLASCNNNPYAGTYCYDGNTNIILRLNDDDSFTLVYNMDKINEYYYGKYHIEDNNLQLKFNSDSVNKMFKQISAGKVEGSRINLSKSGNTFCFERE